jgi:putative transcriptional regulator
MSHFGPAELTSGDRLTGQLLIAMPGMLDDMFNGTAVLMCTHSEAGAMGLIINRIADGVSFEELVENLDLLEANDAEVDPEDEGGAPRVYNPQPCPMHVGGPVEPNRGFVLHTPDYFTEGSTVQIISGVCMTATIDILRALAFGNGPSEALLMLGYAAWDAGQLESEIQSNGWLHASATDDIVFSTAVENRYTAAMSQLGVDPSFLVSTAGRA